MYLKKDKKLKLLQLTNKIWLSIFNPFRLFRKVKNLRRPVFIFLLIFVWIFSGQPQIFDFPPKIQETRAETTNLVVTACDVQDVPDTTCYDAISTDGGTSDSFTKNIHIDAPFQTLSADSINSATFYYDSWATLSGTWEISVRDARDGNIICNVDPAPEDLSETTNSIGCSVTTTQLNNGVWLYALNNDGAGPEDVYLDYVWLYVDYTSSSGTLTVDIVNASGDPVASPSIVMGTKAFSFDYQTATGTLGISAEKIRVDNSTAGSAWTLTIAANSGSTSFWDGASSDYDFNDPTASAGDGGDADNLGGQMTINASNGTLGGTCAATGITKGTSTAFSEGVTDSITLLTADATADTGCYWDFTGVDVSQTIPAEQPAASDYTINMTLTVTAS